jgi:capsular exopolysaccharide synthesis family protein
MSKIHQALRKAEKEGRSESLSPSRDRKNILAEIKQEVLKSRTLEPAGSISIQEESNGVTETARMGPYSIELNIASNSKLVAQADSRSIPSEHYRALKTKVFQLHESRGFKTLLVTSSGMSEGKTLTAANLALTMAKEINLRVLLVDGDLRRPAVHRFLGFSSSTGFADYLSGNASMEEIVHGTQIPNFSVVPVGKVPDNPVELLNSQRMRLFMTYVTDKFDWIIFDSPPLTALADADILSTLTDGVLLVVRAFQTPSDMLARSLEALKGKNILGVVLNGYEDDKAQKYSYYYHKQGS